MEWLAARGNLEFGADMHADLGGVVIDEMADPMMGNAAEFRPLTQGANGGLATDREDATGAKTDDVSELGGEAGS